MYLKMENDRKTKKVDTEALTSIKLGDIHKIQMGVSFNKQHSINRYLEKRINRSKNYFIHPTFEIMTNRYNMIDTSLMMMNDEDLSPMISSIVDRMRCFLERADKHVITSIENLIDVSVIKENIQRSYRQLQKKPTKNTIRIMNICLKMYDNECKKDSVVQSSTVTKIVELARFVVSAYSYIQSLMIDNRRICENHDLGLFIKKMAIPGTSDSETFAGVYYLLSQIEWFHILVTLLKYDEARTIKPDNTQLVVFGNECMGDHGYMDTYSIEEIKSYHKDDYPAHSTIHIITNDCIYSYDPDKEETIDENTDSSSDDDTTEQIDPITRFAHILFLKHIEIDSEYSIQSLTEDTYCIFHCIWFIIRLIDIADCKLTSDNIDKISDYIDQINKITNFDSVMYFIKDIELRSMVDI